MEINKNIHRLLISSNINDQKIGLEILKNGEFNDFEYFIYHYRYRLKVSWLEYFDYYFDTVDKSCLGGEGQPGSKTAMVITNWKNEIYTTYKVTE